MHNNTGEIYTRTSQVQEFARQAVEACRDPTKVEEIWRHMILIWAARFWKPTTTFMDDGNGMITALCETGIPLKVLSISLGMIPGLPVFETRPVLLLTRRFFLLLGHDSL